jgi:hypothetical protein
MVEVPGRRQRCTGILIRLSCRSYGNRGPRLSGHEAPAQDLESNQPPPLSWKWRTRAATTHASATVQPGIVVPPDRARSCIMPIRTWLARPPRGWGRAGCACRDPPIPKVGWGSVRHVLYTRRENLPSGAEFEQFDVFLKQGFVCVAFAWREDEDARYGGGQALTATKRLWYLHVRTMHCIAGFSFVL